MVSSIGYQKSVHYISYYEMILLHYYNHFELNRLILPSFKFNMQSQTIKSKSKNNKKLSPKSKRSYSITSKSQEIQSDPQQSQYLANSNTFNAKSTETSVNKQINKLLKQCKKHPTQSLASLCNLYQTHPSFFYQYDTRKSKQKPIFDLLINQIQYYSAFPLMQREKTVIINQKFLEWIKDKKEPMCTEELLKINQIEAKVFELILNGQRDRIIQNMLYLVLKIPIVIAHSCKSQEEIIFAQELINQISVGLVQVFDMNIQMSQQTQSSVIQFNLKSLQLLTIISNNATIANYHLFSFATLTFTSKYSSLCKKIISDASLLLQDKPASKDESADQRSAENSQAKNRGVLLVSALLKFDSVIDPQSIKKKSTFIKQVTLLTLLTFKSLFLRLIDELQHLQKPSIPPSVIRGMFQIAKFCNDINKLNLLPQIIKKIQSVKQLASFLSNQERFFSTTSKDLQPFQAFVKNVQKNLFEIMCKIEKSICNYNLQIFMDLYIEHPLTFRSEYFIQQTFKNQHDTIILQFMKAFTSKWALTDLKTFDFSFYLLHFIKKCISKDTMDVLGAFIKQISVEELIKVNVVIFKLSFEDDNKKYMVLQNSCRHVQFASVTSAGYSDKFMLINQLMPQFPEQLIWRQLIHHLVNSFHYIVVKSFYNVVNYQLNLSSNMPHDPLAKLIKCFETFIQNEEIQEIYATFQLIYCILFRKDTNCNGSMQKYEAKILQIILMKGRKLITLHESVCSRRRSAMNSINMSKQMMNETMRCFDRLKKMNVFFFKSLHLWIQNLTNIKEMMAHNHSYEDIIQILLQLIKDYEYKEFHQVRYLSHYCSEKYFNNIVEYKVKSKILKKQIIALHYIMVLKQIINDFMQKYPSQPIDSFQCLQVNQILNYYSFVLRLPIEVANQRQNLKSKLAILYQIVQLTAFFKANKYHSLFDLYLNLYTSSFRQSMLQIIVQNPQYVSKYERQFIIHMRVLVITELVKQMGNDFQIISEQQTYNLLYEMCYDKHIEIRFMIINMLASRFKHQLFSRFLSNKYETAALLTTIAIFETNPPIKAIATKIGETFKTAGKEVCSLGLIILLHSVKHILNLTYRNLCKEQYCTYIDSFLTSFHKFWLNQKEWEYTTYNFACKFIEQNKMHFILQQPTFQSQVQTYYVQKQGSDYCLQRQIKQYLKKQQDFSFQFPPDQQLPNSRRRLINNLMYSLPFRIFHKVKQVINKKSRSSRILKYKKDIGINWELLQSSGLVQCHKRPEAQLINLHI